jgi:excisionase family DNA binding protein
MAEQPLAYRPKQALQVFPAGRTVLYELIRSGEIPSFKVGRARFITHADLVAWMERSVEEQRSNKTSA